jgi:hypothetical protein
VILFPISAVRWTLEKRSWKIRPIRSVELATALEAHPHMETIIVRPPVGLDERSHVDVGPEQLPRRE